MCSLKAHKSSNLTWQNHKTTVYLGVAQLVARYLGVVEAARSSLVTQTRKSIENSRFLCFFLLFLAELCNLCCRSGFSNTR